VLDFLEELYKVIWILFLNLAALLGLAWLSYVLEGPEPKYELLFLIPNQGFEVPSWDELLTGARLLVLLIVLPAFGIRAIIRRKSHKIT
jgi:hypothetical protein